MNLRTLNPWPSIRAVLPRVGTAGSRSAQLSDATQKPPVHEEPTPREARLFRLWQWMGTVATLLIGLGGLGAGALPVVNNPYSDFPLGSLMARMLQTSSALVMLGIGILVFSWVAMARFVGISFRFDSAQRLTIGTGELKLTLVAWSLPLVFTAPLFTQDIYSYLANGSIVTQGLSPYEAGPVELLGTENALARSVPFIWAQSPSPYGPVALGIAAAISQLTSDGIVFGVLAHRLISLVGIIAMAWALAKLARRCGIAPETALWLGVLNPVVMLHLLGGIHNEAILLGFLLVGIELALRGIDNPSSARRWSLLFAGGFLLACAGMVKVTGFIALGFVGMALARWLANNGMRRWLAVVLAAGFYLVTLVASIAVITLITGIDLGWISAQGGAATIRSWLSLTTALGVISGFIGTVLGLGDHTESILVITRTLGVVVSGIFLLRMLFATFRGAIHPVGGLGMATLVLVIFFPVVHPWYLLWAIVPLAAWANRAVFRVLVTIYCVIVSFLTLPRGMALPPEVVAGIYAQALLTALVIVGIVTVVSYLLRHRKTSTLQ
ncbi:polyprenol phosphomannose-dependent alpha 1,6 mannosyltransferase MptB [Corynebacterium pseudodiphtheriticum]|uniref:polyprenol phosphomannose-dependent alpha 1,6 mannosyltransferase MptB n=1 Tax=Corynebacterium pseudodiphtheriticum TaxID=37637 RepID=UPI00234D779E|nr:polyprenol phosphomannose-dependent alpha 1,6 mannosyltransferase MptB [Corynebacterium pseudodiphtheriticum]MDC7088288.1 polyprenol phosphomannose-dependent alpha 1,6 mannosyltransferase MptB [Corynebacterium pseudodiphtheriticum]MDK4321596.1 polyprenol phosphomannose-dependent alpha 1,6 mannosyltransferase MptB [Corynebacterium pseudodiphtheriticum]